MKKNYELDFIRLKTFYCSKDFLKKMYSKLDFKQMIYMYYIYSLYMYYRENIKQTATTK